MPYAACVVLVIRVPSRCRAAGPYGLNAAPTAIGYRTPNVFYHNAQVAFEVTEKTRFQLGVDNLFDRKAPYIPSFTDGNTDTMTYDLLRRRFYVGVRTAF